MININPNPSMIQPQLYRNQHQNNSYFLSKYHDKRSQISKEESKLKYKEKPIRSSLRLLALLEDKWVKMMFDA